MNSKNRQSPKIVLGMPVYNGSKHLAETLDSILNQTFTDFSLIISDNASTDNTQEICEIYASRDSRIRYHRQPINQGMAFNFNYVFQPGNSPYFKWAAHDDLLKPDYLLKCINLLEEDSRLSMAHCPSARIDDDSNELGMYKDLGLSASRISERFWRVLWTINIYEVYSVMRVSNVCLAKPVGDYIGAERNFLAEVLLQGDIAYCKQSLFARRDHPRSMTAMHLEAKENNDFLRRQKVHSSNSNVSELKASVIRFREYFISLSRFSMPLHEQVRCVKFLLDWGIRRVIEKITQDEEKHRRKIYASEDFS